MKNLIAPTGTTSVHAACPASPRQLARFATPAPFHR